MLMTIAARILKDYAELDSRATVPAAAARRLAETGLPDSHNEHWRYANLRALDGIADFKPANAAFSGAEAMLPAPLEDHLRVVLIDGRYHPALSCKPEELQAAGVVLTRGPAADGAVTAGGALHLLNQMFAAEALTLTCSGQAKLELCLLASANSTACYPNLNVQLAANATLQVVERHLGGGPAQLICADTSLQLSPRASLWHYRLQEYGNGVVFFDNYDASLAHDARLTLCQIGVGAGTARHSAHIALRGDRSELHWQAMAVANQKQVNDTWVQVEHLAKSTLTQQRFRGIAADQARVACSAELQVPAAGAGARVQQGLRGLIDGRGAEVDLRPRLEIRTDDIKASHGATTGQLDEGLLFYLLSRGIDPATARTLLKWAFLGDVLGEIPVPALRRAAEQAAAGHLADLVATGVVS